LARAASVSTARASATPIRRLTKLSGLPNSRRSVPSMASAVIYGGVDAQGIVFDGVDQALAVEGTDLRLFGKPESFVKRRMGVALARAADIDVARERAKRAAHCVKPRHL
jgi:phosphoribosylglycinamide formyltransferase 2